MDSVIKDLSNIERNRSIDFPRIFVTVDANVEARCYLANFQKTFSEDSYNFVVRATEYSVSNFITAFASDLLSGASCFPSRETPFLDYLVLEPDPYTK